MSPLHPIPEEWGSFRFSELIAFEAPLPRRDHDKLLANQHKFFFEPIHGAAALREIERKRYAHLPIGKTILPTRLYKAVPLQFADLFWGGSVRLGTVEHYVKTEDRFARDGYEGSFITICSSADGSESYCMSADVGERSLCFCSSLKGGRFGDESYAVFEIHEPTQFVAALNHAVTAQCRPNFPLATVHSECTYRHTRIIRTSVTGSIRDFIKSDASLDILARQFGKAGGYDRYFVKHWAKRVEREHRVLWLMADSLGPVSLSASKSQVCGRL